MITSLGWSYQSIFSLELAQWGQQTLSGNQSCFRLWFNALYESVYDKLLAFEITLKWHRSYMNTIQVILMYCDRLASVGFIGQHVASLLLPTTSSIFSAEPNIIRFALKISDSSDESKFAICSDSLIVHQLDTETNFGAGYLCRRHFCGTNRRINICRLFIQVMYLAKIRKIVQQTPL
jgi:hypothetical protein